MWEQRKLTDQQAQPRPFDDADATQISPERKETLEIMRSRINAFAENLFQACNIFRDTQLEEPGSQKAKAAIFTARQHVEGAIHELKSTLNLISLNPDQVAHIAHHMNRASHRLERIRDLTNRLLTTDKISHYPKTLATLARACPRASYQLENSLDAPLKLTLRPPHHREGGPPDPNLNA